MLINTVVKNIFITITSIFVFSIKKLNSSSLLVSQSNSSPSQYFSWARNTSLGPRNTSLGPCNTSLGPCNTSIGPRNTSLGPQAPPSLPLLLVIVIVIVVVDVDYVFLGDCVVGQGEDLQGDVGVEQLWLQAQQAVAEQQQLGQGLFGVIVIC